MKQFLRLFQLFFFSLLAAAVAVGQVNGKMQEKEQLEPKESAKDLPSVIPQDYIFFGSDTLQGFDLNACYNDLGRYNVHSHLSKGERKSYMFFRQLDFVRTKYHLPKGRPFVDPLKIIESAQGITSRPLVYQPKALGTPNSKNTMTGIGKLFSNGQGSNPKPASTNPSCVGWDWENGNGPIGAAAWANSTWGSANECGTCTGNWYADVMYANFPNYGNAGNNYQGIFENVGLHNPDGNNANVLTGCDHHVIVSTGTDPYGAGSMVYPGGGSYSVRMGGPNVNLGGQNGRPYGNACSSPNYANGTETDNTDGWGWESAGEIIWQNITVSANNALLTYYYNVVLSDGGHPSGEQPYFNAWILDITDGNTLISCSRYTQECTVGTPPAGYTQYCATCWDGAGNDTPGPVNYSGWQANTIDMTPYIGKTIQVQFMTAGCTPGGHFGYAYVDGSCGPKQLTVQSPPVCLGTGNMNVSAPPMPPGTAYSWSGTGTIVGSKTGSSISISTAGTFTVTITPPAPNNTCPITISSVVNFAPKPTEGLPTATNITCNGLSNGTASAANAAGGTPAYTYNWSTGAGTQAVNNLGIGTYTVTVSDANGCTATNSINITAPTAVTAAASTAVNATCGKNNGQVNSASGGGTPGYSYLWTGGGATQNVTALGANTYTVTITDSKGCTATSSTTITNTPGVTAAAPTVNNLNCNGKSTGTATGVPSGGTPGYNYSWSQGAATQTISNLAAATYTVTITDANGCTSTTTAVITQPATAVSASYTSVNSTCTANNNGQATASGAGGTAGYAYSWNTGAATNVISGVASGSYTVTVTDAKGCTTSTTAIVNNTSGPVASISAFSNVNCFGQATGSATATQGGGTPGFSYTWSPSGGAASVASNLATGTYTVTIKDANNCTSTATKTITQPAAALSAATTPVSATCGKANGTASVSAGGGTAGYTYLWTTGGTSSSVNGLTAASYTVTVTDSKGCTQSTTTNIGNTAGPTLSVSASSNVNCFGQATGSISTLEVNGTPGFSYVWAPSGGAGSSAAALAAGTYTVTITDANGCTSTTLQTITQPASGLTAATTPISSTCTANNNGQASVLAGGGTAGYAYQWTTGGTNSSITGLASGNYTVTVTDTKGCTKSATVAVGNTPGPVASANAVANVSCNRLATGSADASVTGGTSAFNYVWFPGGMTGANVGALAAATYTVSVTDANGCTSTSTVTITQPPSLIPTASGVTATCGNHNGSVSVSTAGGVPGYQYLWSNGATSQTVSGLAANTYTVTVTDSKGCTNSSVQTVSNAGGPTAAVAGSANLSCNGGNNGSASATVSGGAAPFNFAWSNGTTGTTGSAGFTSSIAGLAAGTYTMSVTDVNGCLSTVNITLTAPAALNSSITSQTNAGCGTGNGQATINVTGGTAGYTYNWSNGSTTNAISSVTAGIYTLTVTDSKGCTGTTSVNITGSPAVTATSANVSSTCGISNGHASASPGGGTPGFTYFWSPGGATSQTVTSLSPGTYSVTITDTKGCTITTTTTIGNLPGPVVSVSAFSNVNCFGQSTGSVSTTEVSGSPGFSYTWAPAGGAGATASGLAAGTYTVTIKDANNCTSTAAQVVTQPAALTAATTPVSSTCITNNNGQASVLAGGGTAGYAYLWSTGGTNTSISGVASGTYSVTVTDTKACTVLATAVINNTPGPVLSANAVANVSCNRLATGSANASVTGGTAAFNYVWFPGGITGANAGSLAANTYTVSVTDANGCTSTSTVAITQPPSLIPTASSVSATCGSPDGSVAVSTTGGTPAYQYSWSNGATSQTVTALAANSYTVTVTDSKGCTNSTVKTINNASGPVVSALPATNLTCNGDNNGSASVTVSGVAPPFNFAWSNGTTGSTGSTGFTSSISGLTAGTYTLSVTDINGCVVSDNVTLTAPPALSSSVSSQTNAACGGSNGQATVNVSGGTSGYFYTWSNGSTTNGISGVTANTYSLTITDSKGCPYNTTVIITGSPSVTSASSNVSSTCGSSNGQASVSPGGGSPGFSYFWSPGGATAQTVAGLAASSYTVTVTDTKGCTSTTVTNVGNIAGPTLSISAFSNLSCNLQPTGSVSTSEVNGTSGFGYIWAPSGGTGATASGLAAGTYTVTIKDANNCTSTATQLITQPPALTAATTPVSSTCTTNNNGQASVLAGGGTAGYSYLWSTSGTGSSISGVASGTYSVTVTDAKNCTTTASAVISNTPGPVVSAFAVSNVSCNRMSTGSADASVTGGTPGFNYVWFPGGSTGTNVGSLSATTYTVSVTDANGCTSVTTLTITEPPSLIPTGSSVAATCGNSDGSVSVNAVGGTPTYQYVWSTGATSQTVSGLLAKSYTVTVTDSKGCTNSTVQTVNNAGGPAVAISGSVNLVCNGNSNGSVSATVSGASAPFNFAWSNGTTGSTGSTGFTSSISGLTAGSYTLSVTDVNGCLSSQNVTLTAPAAIVSSISSQTNAGCGTSNGQASVSVTGGSGGYTYNWSNGSTTNGISGVTANTYVLTVTDVKGCSDVTTINITGSPAVTAVNANVPSTCGVSNGQVSTTPGGGSPGFSYFWAPGGAAAQTVTGLAPGTYTVTITDTKGCTATSFTTINSANGPVATIAPPTNVACGGNSTGAATVTAAGGTANYTYSWSTGITAITSIISNSTTNQLNNLTAGIYGVTITDANGCSSTSLVDITQPGVLTPVLSSTSPTCGSANGSVSVNVNGGTPSYSYIWNTGNAGQTLNGISAGVYTVTVSDGNGCTASANKTVINPGAPLVSLDTLVKINCNGGRAGSITANVSGGTGALVYSWSNGVSGVTAISGLTAGSYTLSVTDITGCVSTLSATLANPALLSPTISSQTNVSCGLSNGKATVAVTGGSGSYTYSWSNGNTTTAISGVNASVYTLTVTDSLGCTATQLVTISNSGTPSAVLQSSVNSTCNGASNGSAIINTTGGTPVYTYNWSGGITGTSSTENNLSSGTYSVTVSDANGCTSVTSVTISQPTKLAGTLKSTAAICGAGNGTALATSSGGTAPYVFSWSNGVVTKSGLSSQISNLATGSYSVTVVDANSCTQLFVTTIGNTSSPIVILSGAATICIGQSATLKASVVGGSPAYTYSWSNGSGSAGPLTVSPLTTTSYSLIVTDSTGCASAVQTEIVKVNPPLNVTLTSTGTTVCNGSSATITAHATGGNTNYSYSWQPSGTGASVTFTPTGSTIYTVTVTDNCGTPQATAALPFTMDVPPTIRISSNVNTGCGSLLVQFASASTPACTNSEWYFGDSDSSSVPYPNHLYSSPGTYTFSMKCTDANGCTTTQTGTNTINVIQGPKANFSSPSVFVQDSAISFTSLSAGASNLIWNFGDTSSQANNTSVLINPTHTYLDSGKYCIWLYAYNAGCVDSIDHCLTINEACSLPANIPNVFSPNDDGINDLFTIKSSGLTTLICTLYNRWGMLIYEYDAVKTGWDGHSFSDNKAPDGTYFYILKATCTDSKVTQGNGFLQLVR